MPGCVVKWCRANKTTFRCPGISFHSYITMGRHFGDLAVIRGIVYYKLSPHEQKPLATAFARGLPNFVPRTLATMYTWLPPFVFGYLVYTIVESSYKTSKKKDPRIFFKEVPPPPKCPPK